MSFIELTLACLVMGVGIGADVALATMMRVGDMSRKRTVVIWITGVTITHTLFPMFGYLLAYFSVNSAPLITPIIGLLAFSFIAFFIYQELSSEEEDGDGNQLLITVGLILAVSWDALWSGPAKSAQVMGWPDFWVWVSFIIVGGVVSAFAVLSYFAAKHFNITDLQPKWLAFDLAQWLQLSIIGYFGLLALLRYTFGLDIAWWQLLVGCGGMMALILYRRSLYYSPCNEEKYTLNKRSAVQY